MWNFRRETLLFHFEEDLAQASLVDESARLKAQEKEKETLLKELYFTQQALMRNPKSYWCWNQREWATQRLSRMSACPWEKELALCGQLLHHDARNCKFLLNQPHQSTHSTQVHCWNYRRYVVAQSHISHEAELKFTTNLIEENFSNYSAWHQRSKLLPLIFTDPEEYHRAIDEELEVVKNAFYTMPNDSSAWFYHRWLINQNPLPSIILREIEAVEELLQILELPEEKKCRCSLLPSRSFCA